MTPDRSRNHLLNSGIGVPDARHMCLLYRDEQDQFRQVARFFEAALQSAHKILYITDTNPAEEVRRRFAELGVDLGTSSGAEVKTTIESYHPAGRFEPERMCASIETLVARALAEGFAGSRCAGEMGWAARKIPGSERLIEYETMLTHIIERLPFSGICQYDVRLFDGPTILAILDVHPFLLVSGQVLRNPNYVQRNVAAVTGTPRDECPVL